MLRRAHLGALNRALVQAKKDVPAKGGPSREMRRVGAREKVKNKFLADRTAINTELTRLENAEKASWAPYAVLRDPTGPHRAESPVRSPGSSPVRSPLGKIDSSRLKAQAKGKPGDDGGTPVIQVSTSRPSEGVSRPANRAEESAPSSPVVGVKKTRDRDRWKTEWKLDPMQSRSGEPDLALDDPRMVRAPGWARANALHSLEVIAPENDTEALEAAVARLQDPEGMVRVAALRAIRKLAQRGNRDVIDAVIRLVAGSSRDMVANVRKEACLTLAAIANKGLPPSRINQATGTKRDVEAMQRDSQVIDALTPMLDDNIASVRMAAQEAMDVVNVGWQRWEVNERRLDDSHLLDAPTRKPLKTVPPPRQLGDLDAKLWNRTYSQGDLRPLKEEVWRHKDDFKGAKVSGVTLAKRNPRYNSLAGYKFVSYNDLLRQEAQVQRFEQAQEKAAEKVQKEVLHLQAVGAREISTHWLGIEWVDRTQRSHLGQVLHPMGAGVEEGTRDHVEVPYTAGYNGFGTPMGYKYI